MDASYSQPLATILVVDDTPANLSLMSDLLKEHYRVKVAINGARALEIARQESAPDLILLDIMMPDFDGFQVCRELKQDAHTRHIPVIFLTAKVEPADEEHGLSLGAVDYISKPISPSVLLARVHTQLAVRRSTERLEQQVQLRTDALQQTQELLARMVAIGIDLAYERDRSALLRRVLLSALSLAHCDSGVFFEIDAQQTLRARLHTHDLELPPAALSLAPPAPVRPDPVLQCARTQRSVRIDAPAQDAHYDCGALLDLARRWGLALVSVLCVPVVSRKQQLLGVLQMFNALEPGSNVAIAFDAAHVAYLETLARQTAAVLDNVPLADASDPGTA